MVKDAEAHAAEDRKRKEAVEARNRADPLAYEVEKNLKEHGDKLDGAACEHRGELNGCATRSRARTTRIDKASDSLQKVWHQAAAQMYQSAGRPPPPGGGRRRGRFVGHRGAAAGREEEAGRRRGRRRLRSHELAP